MQEIENQMASLKFGGSGKLMLLFQLWDKIIKIIVSKDTVILYLYLAQNMASRMELFLVDMYRNHNGCTTIKHAEIKKKKKSHSHSSLYTDKQ